MLHWSFFEIQIIIKDFAIRDATGRSIRQFFFPILIVTHLMVILLRILKAICLRPGISCGLSWRDDPDRIM